MDFDFAITFYRGKRDSPAATHEICIYKKEALNDLDNILKAFEKNCFNATKSARILLKIIPANTDQSQRVNH